MASVEAEIKADDWGALLTKCTDAVLLEECPKILRLLPEDAQERCIIVLRQALEEELEGGVLDDDATAAAAMRLALQSEGSENPERQAAQHMDAGSQEQSQSRGNFLPAKRPRHAMAMPFRGVVSRAPQEENTTAASEDAVPQSCSVYVANLPFRTEDVKVSNFFEDRCRPAQVLEVTLLKRPDGRPAGSAIILFDSIDGATKAIALNGKPGLEYRKLIVREDRPRRGPGDVAEEGSPTEKTKGKGKRARNKTALQEKEEAGTSKDLRGGGAGADRSVIVKNLAFDASEANLGALFASIGEVAKVRIAKDSKTGKARGFAVVEFSEASHAEAALRHTGALVRERPVRIERLGETPGSTAAARPQVGAKKSLDFSEQLGISDTEDDEAAEEAASVQQQGTEDGPDAKRAKTENGKGSKPLEAKQVEYPAGDEGLLALSKLACGADSADSLLESTPLEELTGRLSALGFKAGGTPKQRAERIWALKDAKNLDAVPQAFFAKPSQRSKGNAA